MFYQSWHVAGFPWDKCQTPKKDFYCLRLSLGSVIESVLADPFHGSLEMVNTKHSHVRTEASCPPAQYIFGIGFRYFGLCNLTLLWVPVVLSICTALRAPRYSLYGYIYCCMSCLFYCSPWSHGIQCCWPWDVLSPKALYLTHPCIPELSEEHKTL